MRKAAVSTSILLALLVGGCVSDEQEPISTGVSGPKETISGSADRDDSLSSEDKVVSAPDWVQAESPASVDLCKVLDGQSEAARLAIEGMLVDGKRARGNIGFPISPPTLPIEGESNILAAMVSFDDAPPTGITPEGFLRPQLEKIEQWGDFWSQGKLDFNFIMPDDWVHLSVNHSDYPVGPDLPFSERQGNSNEIIKLIAEAMPSGEDYSNLDGVLIYWSPNIEHFESDLGLQGFEGIQLPFPGGSKEAFFWSGNTWYYEGDGTLTPRVKSDFTWSSWIYFMLDSMGLHNHGPGNGWAGGLQQNQMPNSGEYSGAIIGWDEFRLGWTDDSQVQCLEPDSIVGGHQFILQAREIQGGDRRLAVVPFEGQGALVIESRRPVGYSNTWGKEKSGLLAYFVDTELEIERVDSFTRGGCGNDPNQPKWAWHIFKDGFSGDCRNFSNAFIREGEKLSFQSVQVELVHSAEDRDYVRVSRVD